MKELVYIPEYGTGNWGKPIALMFIGGLIVAAGVEVADSWIKFAFIQTGLLAIGGAIWMLVFNVRQIVFSDRIIIKHLFHSSSYDYPELVDVDENHRVLMVKNRVISFQSSLNSALLFEMIDNLLKDRVIQRKQFTNGILLYNKDMSLLRLLLIIFIAIVGFSIDFLFSAPNDIHSGVIALISLPYAFWLAYWSLEFFKVMGWR
ncbi:MAG: hypothetical protein HY865_10555 [Chloroflexi bacterium]|nr:hypothetical protein [Chloroflexota bacterium]